MSGCGLAKTPKPLPEAPGGPCCIGSAVYGPERCTCWEPEHDRDQAELDAAAVVTTRTLMCAGCAYRPTSPEKTGEAWHADADDLEDVAAGGTFYCHDGMRRIARLRHPEGMVVDGHTSSYDPPYLGAVPHRADGQPAQRCAGWDARRRALLQRERPDLDVPHVLLGDEDHARVDQLDGRAPDVEAGVLAPHPRDGVVGVGEHRLRRPHAVELGAEGLDEVGARDIAHADQPARAASPAGAGGEGR